MKNIYEILKDFNETNSTNDKIAKLKKYKSNALFTRILEVTYDKSRFTFGLTMKNVRQSIKVNPFMELADAVEELEIFTSRKLTGNAAINQLGYMLDQLSEEDSKVMELIIGRDLKINVGRTNINKVHKGLIVKPVYKRCGIFTKKTESKIKYPAFCQLKADGTYREMLLLNGKVEFMSRSGEVYEYPTIENDAVDSTLKDGYYFGEITVKGAENRSIGNGLINSDNCPHDDLIFSVWEYANTEEYKKAKLKEKDYLPETPYFESFYELEQSLIMGNFKHIELIESPQVGSAKEAMVWCSEWMKMGLEGAVLKNKHMLLKDGTSTDQLKMKLEIDVEVRMIGHREGKKGTKREGKLGSIQFSNDEGTVKGYASGFNDSMLDEISENLELYMDKIFTVRCNDITKGRNNNHYALSHPRYIEWRNDKNETDTLARMFEQKESAMLLENIL